MRMLSAVLMLFCSHSWAQTVVIGGFNEPGWKPQKFECCTEYEAAADGSVSAMSNNTASGLVWKQKIDLEKTPFLNWRWNVAELPAVTDEQQKSGDDYAARVYVVVDGGLFKWRTKAMNYVWAARKKTGEQWNSPYVPKNVKKLAVAGSDSTLNVWRNEKRNVRADFKALFGKDIKRIDAIAIMTDSDNSKSTAKAQYSSLFFSAD